MPHRSADQAPPSHGGYNAHLAGGRSYQPPPPSHMMHPSEAARMAAFQRAQAYGAHPYRMPPPMWHPSDAAAHLARAEMGHADAVQSHVQRTEGSPLTKRMRADTMESAEETAATALLMASGFRSSPKPKETEEQESSAPVSREPPKKRKKHLDVLRRNQVVDSKLNIDPTTGSPCHVSPGSASSREGDGHTDEIVTIVTQSSRTFLETSSASYDTRETKKEDVPHFPSVLHKVLDMPDASSVLQWLPHGEAWKIVRWDALRREILPRYFPELCKGEDGSMDSFLGQVRSWGFEEITDGPDAGAYRHLSFVRGTPKLCKHMTYKAPTSLGSPETKSPGSVDSHTGGTKSPEASQSILQVPSLTSRSDGEQEPKHATPDQQHVHFNNSNPSSVQSVHERASSIHPGWQHGGMAMSYRTPDGGYADPRLVHRTSPVRHGVTFPPPYSPRFPFRTPGGPPSPLKSGRGGSRLSRTSFPVSQRGKGGRARIVRSPITTPESLASKNESSEGEQSPGLGPHLQKDSAISEISRKMTRKLPLARKAAVDKESPVEATDESSKVNEDS